MDRNTVQGSDMRKADGFTMMELMIVVVIIGILAAVAVPSMAGWFGKKDLDSVVRNMFSQIQLARSDAIRNNMPITISIDKDNEWYEILRTTGGVTVPVVPRVTMPRGIDIVSTTFPPFGGNVTTTGITTRGFATQQGEVRFHSDNAPSASRDRIIEITAGGTVRIRP